MSDINEKYSDEVEKLLEVGKEKEYLSYDDINLLLPPDLNSADDIEAILNVIEAEGILISDTDEKSIEIASGMLDSVHREIEDEGTSIPGNHLVFTGISAGTADPPPREIKGDHTHQITNSFLSKLIPVDQREWILGDMEEEYDIGFDANGTFRAKLWYYSQALSTVRLYMNRLKLIALLRKVLKLGS
jgi:sigma-70-like protein